MEQTRGFYDFCVPHNKDEKLLRTMLKELVELGYRTIAIEQTFDHTQKTPNKRSAPDPFPEPYDVHTLQDEFKGQLRILQRLTILYVDGAVTHAMSTSLNIRKFNIIAGQPKTDAALTHCCTTFNGDIVTFDTEVGCKLMVNRKAYNIAVKRGLYFEIKYAPVIADTNNRKNMIKVAHNYSTKGKSKGIIFSSGATNEFELRSPYDVANLAYIFGMSEDQGKNAVDRFCRQVFLHAESRRFGKTIMFVKCLGPIVFSSTEDSDNDDDEDGMQSGNDVEMHLDVARAKQAEISESSGNDNDDDNDAEQPTKKPKISE